MRPAGSDAAKPGPRGCARAPGGAGPRWWPGGGGGGGGKGGSGGGREAERGPSVEFQRVSGRVFSGMFLQNSGWRLKLLLLQLQEIM